MPLAYATKALGTQGWSQHGPVEVPVDQVVGTAARTDEFDRKFRPRFSRLRARWQSVADAVSADRTLPPVELVQMGEMYFVVDGHHRVSVARALDRPTVTAQVRRACTIAYACACLRVLDLPSKAAERAFLERFPLPYDVRPWLWLDDPHDWTRLEQAAEAWVFCGGRPPPEELESRVEQWWREQVTPAAYVCCGHVDADRPDLLGYLATLTAT